MTSAMVIAYLTGCYGRSSDTFIRDEVGRLRDRGFDVRTFSVRVPSDDAASSDVSRARRETFYILDKGLPGLLARFLPSLLKLDLKRVAGAARLSFDLAPPGFRGLGLSSAYFVEGCVLADRLRGLGASHIHNHIAEGAANVAMIAAHIVRVPFSLTVHGPGEFDHPEGIRLAEKAGRAAFVCAISDFCRSQILRWLPPADWERVTVVRSAVHDDFLAAPLDAPVGDKLLVVGRLVPEKGHLVLLEAVAKLIDRRPTLEVEILGEGLFRRQIAERIAELGLHRHVTLTGPASRRDVRSKMLDARCVVAPSFAEGLPVVLLEALALGRPVISTSVAGIPEIVIPGRTGWLVPPGSVRALTRAIDEMLTLPVAALTDMGRAGREIVIRRHSPRRHVQLLAALIEQAAEAGRSRPRPSGSAGSAASDAGGTTPL